MFTILNYERRCIEIQASGHLALPTNKMEMVNQLWTSTVYPWENIIKYLGFIVFSVTQHTKFNLNNQYTSTWSTLVLPNEEREVA
jgi:hypothetical protein